MKKQVAILSAVIILACRAASPIASTSEEPGETISSSGVIQAPVEADGPATSAGQTYYVAPDGSDASDGSSGNPWLTLQHAVDQVVPGDTILVRSGSYQGMRIERSGSVDAWITIRPDTGADVLVSAPGPNNRHDSNIEVETWEGDGVVAYWIIEGLEVAGSPNWGIDIRGNEVDHSHHFIVRDNIVHDNGLASVKTGIFTAFVDDVIISGNESYSNGEHGIYLSNSGDRFLVEGNRLYDNARCGLHMNGDASQGGDGIISDGTVEANIIYENGLEGCSAINMDGVTDSVVRNNLLYRNLAGGISLFQQDGAVCARNNRILNNTIVMAVDGRWAINLSHSSCIGNELYNNIIYSYHDRRGSIVIPAPGIEGFASDYNIVMDRFSADDDNSVISLSEWQALGYDLHSIVAAPEALFIDPEGDDYHLSGGSPAIDAGVSLPDVARDLDGRPRPLGEAFDIGAYEAQGQSQNPLLVLLPFISRLNE